MDFTKSRRRIFCTWLTNNETATRNDENSMIESGNGTEAEKKRQKEMKWNRHLLKLTKTFRQRVQQKKLQFHSNLVYLYAMKQILYSIYESFSKETYITITIKPTG